MCRSALVQGHSDGRDRFLCSSCGWINYLNPVPVVACIVKDEKGSLLLIERAVEPCKGHWALPGGFVELDETIEIAGARELEEETGLKGKAGTLVGVHLQESETYGYVMIVGMEFQVKDLKLSVGDDASDARFFPAEDMPEVPFKSHKKLIQDYLRTSSSP